MSENQLLQYLNDYKQITKVRSTDEELMFRPITTGQMKNLLVYEDSKDIFIVETIMDDLISSCILSDGFNIDTLTLQDRFNILIDIRRKTKGSTYTFNIKCPECGTVSINNVNLEQLEDVPFNEDTNHLVEVTDNMTIHLDYITRGMQKEAIKIVKKMKGLSDKQKMIEIATHTYALSMKEFVTPDGTISDISTKQKVEFLNNFDQDMYTKITDWYKDNDFGVVFEYEMRCSNCDFEKTEGIPLSNFLA
jgi:hypothetical protein